MKKPALFLRCSLAFVLTITMIPASAQSSGGSKLPDAPAAKTQNPPAAQSQSASPFKDRKEKESYALGMNLGANLKRQGIEIDPNILYQALKDSYSGGKTLMTEEEEFGVLTQLQTDTQAKMEQKQQQEAQTNSKQGEAFLVANKTKEGVVTLPSGLEYKVLTQGTGPKPTAADTVVCNYRGTFIDGKEFDSSAKHGGPATFAVNGVIRGWTEALQLMPVGSKWQLFVPSSMAYAERGYGHVVPPNATLIFEVELLSIKPKESPSTPPAPPK